MCVCPSRSVLYCCGWLTGRVCCQRLLLCAPHTFIAHRVLITIGISPTQINADFVSLLIHPPLLFRRISLLPLQRPLLALHSKTAAPHPR